jgi:hypothetical protein
MKKLQKLTFVYFDERSLGQRISRSDLTYQLRNMVELNDNLPLRRSYSLDFYFVSFKSYIQRVEGITHSHSSKFNPPISDIGM